MYFNWSNHPPLSAPLDIYVFSSPTKVGKQQFESHLSRVYEFELHQYVLGRQKQLYMKRQIKKKIKGATIKSRVCVYNSYIKGFTVIPIYACRAIYR